MRSFKSSIRRFVLVGTAVLAVAIGGAPAVAQDEAGFQTYINGPLREQALREGVSARTLDAVLPSLTYNPRVIELDRDQPGSSTAAIPAFAPYKARHVDAARINR
ncbi:MAG: lytic murein transglycosylase, partial [Sphingomonadales bacterium]